MPSLAEEIFLLSLLEKKESVRVPSSLSLPFALSGAVLLELIFTDCARIEDERLCPYADPEQITDQQMRYAAEKICQTEKPKKLAYWVYLLGKKGNRISKEILLSFVEKGILLKEGKYYHWASTPEESAVEQAPTKYLLKRDIRDAVLLEKNITDRMITLVDLMDSCDMLDHIFTRDEIITARKKVKTFKAEKEFNPTFLNSLERTTDAVKYAISASLSS